MERGGCVYIMTNRHHTTLYTGVTSNLPVRIWEHRHKVYPNSFTAHYNLEKLVYYESFTSIEEAIEREKQIKGYVRKKKDSLINAMNPEWRDLYQEVQQW